MPGLPRVLPDSLLVRTCRLDALRSSYYGPNATHAPEDGGACDAACRAICLTLLDDTWSARLSGRTCPARAVLLRCLLVRAGCRVCV